MAIAIDQATIGGMSDLGDKTTYTLTTTAAVASGGFIVLGFQCVDNPTTITSVTDDGPGLTWSIDKTGQASNWSYAIISAQAPSGMASGTTISINLNTGGIVAIAGACSFTGVATSSPIDGTPLGPTGDTVQAWSTGNYTVQAGSVLVGYCVNTTNDSANTPTAPSVEAWEQGSGGNGFVGAMEYRIESSAGSVAVAGSWGTAPITTNIAVAYLEAASGTPTGASDLAITVGIVSDGTPTAFGAADSPITLAIGSSGTAYQTLHPSADSAGGNWTDDGGGTALAAAIDETTASDSDYIQSEFAPAASGCRVKLESSGDPESSSGHIIRWRVGKNQTGGDAINMTVTLRQGGANTLGAGTQIATFNRNAVDSLTTYEETLSGTEADSITDYGDLYLEFYADTV